MTMNYAISIQTPEIVDEAPLALLTGTFEERLKKAAAYGYTGVELVVCHPELLDPDAIRQLLARYGLKPAAVATGFIRGYRKLTLINSDAHTRDAAAQLLCDLVRFAHAIGAPVVTVGGFRGTAALAGSREEAARQLHTALSGADALAEQLQIKIALEPIQFPESDFLTNAPEVCSFIGEGGYRAVGLLLDIYHVLASEPDALDAFRCNQSQLFHIHLADTDRRPLGLGAFDFGQLRAVLEEIHYHGWQSIELPRGSDPDKNGQLPW